MWAACPVLLPGSGPSEIRTRDLLDHERTLYLYTIQASTDKATFHNTDIDTDTDILTRIIARKSLIGCIREDPRKDVDVGVVECTL